jgi:hypothetical protein
MEKDGIGAARGTGSARRLAQKDDQAVLAELETGFVRKDQLGRGRAEGADLVSLGQAFPHRADMLGRRKCIDLIATEGQRGHLLWEGVGLGGQPQH